MLGSVYLDFNFSRKFMDEISLSVFFCCKFIVFRNRECVLKYIKNLLRLIEKWNIIETNRFIDRDFSQYLRFDTYKIMFYSFFQQNPFSYLLNKIQK